MTVTSSKRIVTFILCLVFCFMFVFPPMPAQAVVGVPALVAGGWAVGSDVIAAVIGALVMAATGVSFDCGYFGDTDNLSTVAYELGYELYQDICLFGGTPAAWIDEVVGLISLTGGFSAGDEIEVPADVLEYARTWASSKYDFSENISITNTGIVNSAGDVFLFSDYTKFSSVDYIGSIINVPESSSGDSSIVFGDLIINPFHCTYYSSNTDDPRLYYKVCIYTNAYNGSIINTVDTSVYGTSGNLTGTDGQVSEYNTQLYEYAQNNIVAIMSYNESKNALHIGYYDIGSNKVKYPSTTYLNLNNLDIGQETATSVISGSDSLSVPQTENKVIQVPDVPMGSIGGYSVPAIQQLTGDMVLPAPGSGEVEDDNDDTNIGDLTPDKPFYVPDTWTGFDSWMKTQSENFKAWRDTIGTSIDNLVDDVTGIGANVNDWITDKWGDFTDTVEGIPDAIATSIENIIASVLDALSQPAQKLREKFDNVLNKILPFFQGVGNLGLSFLGIWHYVITWVGTLAPWISTMFMIWNGLPYAMVVPIYATAAVVIVIGIYRRFFM